MKETSLAYEAHQDGDELPVVLLHGAAGSRLSWPAQARRLAGCPVYALDLPGHGKSPGEACRSIEDYARVVLAWLEALDLKRVILVGHSMGSAIAMQAALAAPSRVAGLLLVGSAVSLKVNPALLRLAASPETTQQAIERIVAWSFSKQAPQRLVALALKRMRETPQAVLLGDLQSCEAFDISARLEEITAPALVVCGTDDRMTPLAGAQALANGLKQARLELLSGAGHMLMLEQPLAFTALLADFVQGVA
jgi:pimeloyl-ACP methyl ester carboxylesterase